MNKIIIKELFNSFIPKEYYKKNKDKFKNIEIFSFEENNEELNLNFFSLPVSNDKIKSALGIEKLPLSAEEGLAKTMKSFKTN